MTDISPTAPSGYMSDGEILAWLEEKSEEQYGNVRALMTNSNQRGELMKDLTQLKADMDQGKPSDEIVQEMQDIESKYADSPFKDELHDLLGPMETALTPPGLSDAESAERDALTAEMLDPDTDPDTAGADIDRVNALNAKEQPPSIASYSEAFGTKLQSEVDQLNRLDQVGLVEIQSEIGDARQTAQLASDLIASNSQTSNAIISNYRG